MRALLTLAVLSLLIGSLWMVGSAIGGFSQGIASTIDSVESLRPLAP